MKKASSFLRALIALRCSFRCPFRRIDNLWNHHLGRNRSLDSSGNIHFGNPWCNDTRHPCGDVVYSRDGVKGAGRKKIKQMLRQKHECSHTVWYRTLFQIHFYAFQVSTIQFQVSPILFWVVPILFRVSPILFQVSLILPQVSPILFQVSKHHSNQKQPKPSWRHIKNNAKHIIHINHCKPEQSCDRQTYCLQPTLWH